MQIKTMTAAQAAKMPEWVNKWLEIGLSTAPADFDAATEAEARATFGDEMVNRNITVMQRLGFVLRGSRPKFKEYMLRVPPTVRTAREAVAWTFERDPKSWRPALET
jgi:hypothetical protein